MMVKMGPILFASVCIGCAAQGSLAQSETYSPGGGKGGEKPVKATKPTKPATGLRREGEVLFGGEKPRAGSEGEAATLELIREDRLRLDWATDSAFRFFPVLPDEEFGYCLHQADLATNKVLALAGRSEVRDFLDTLLIDRTYLSLGAVIWAFSEVVLVLLAGTYAVVGVTLHLVRFIRHRLMVSRTA